MIERPERDGDVRRTRRPHHSGARRLIEQQTPGGIVGVSAQRLALGPAHQRKPAREHAMISRARRSRRNDDSRGTSILLGRAGLLARCEAKSFRSQPCYFPILLADFLVELRELRFRRRIAAAKLVEHLADGELACFGHGSTSLQVASRDRWLAAKSQIAFDVAQKLVLSTCTQMRMSASGAIRVDRNDLITEADREVAPPFGCCALSFGVGGLPARIVADRNLRTL